VAERRDTSMSSNALGRSSSFAVFMIGLAYLVALSIGFATRGLHAPIIDPLLAIMEVLTLVGALLMLVMMAAIHGRAPPKRRTAGALALAFMIMTAGLTSAVHFVALTATRQLGATALIWPSPAYALELLAWDVFLGLSLVFAALTFEDNGREARVRRGLLLCGVLCLLGAGGPVSGHMRLQFIGVLAYGGLLPFVSLLVCLLFHSEAVAERAMAA
jgi:hypothetical protein